MTLKERLDERIMLVSMEAFNWTPYMYEKSSHTISEKIEGEKVLTFSMALLKFLLWLAENIFTKEGKLSLPIWKWPSVISNIRDFINSI
jgi:uncharacterized membrane protein YoaT (DUF817 family)